MESALCIILSNTVDGIVHNVNEPHPFVELRLLRMLSCLPPKTLLGACSVGFAHYLQRLFQVVTGELTELRRSPERSRVLSPIVLWRHIGLVLQ